MNRPNTISSATDTTADDAWADPAWRVDSATRPCCGGLGVHARDCTATTLDELCTRITSLRRDLSAAVQHLADDAPLWAVVDASGANDHLRAASVLLGQAASQLGDGGTAR